jgi:hypothetical protein
MPFVQLIFCLIFTGFLSRCKECGKDVLFSVAKMRIHLKQKHRMMWAKYKKQLLLQGRKKRTKDSELAAASSDGHLQDDGKKVGDAASNSKDIVNASDDKDGGNVTDEAKAVGDALNDRKEDRVATNGNAGIGAASLGDDSFDNKCVGDASNENHHVRKPEETETETDEKSVDGGCHYHAEVAKFCQPSGDTSASVSCS